MTRIGDRGEMEAFVRCVELGSFSAAARELRLSPSALSKLVTRLERSLGARLVSRSPRRIAATAEGELFLARCRRILAELEGAESEIGRARAQPRGRLRMHMGVGFGISQGVNALPVFFERHPEVELDLMVEDRTVDLLQENVDISTWSFPADAAAPRNAGSVIARKLFDYDRILCAAPAYLERHGTPHTPEDLARHRCMIVSTVARQSQWLFETPAGPRTFDVPPTIAVNNVDSKFRLALWGLGIAQFSEYIVADALRNGRLVRVLPDSHRSEPFSQFALYPRQRHRLPRVAAMLDFLVETFAHRPWREAGSPRGKRALARVK